MKINLRSPEKDAHRYAVRTCQIEFKDGTVSYSETLDTEDPTLVDRDPKYDMDKHLGYRPPITIQ